MPLSPICRAGKKSTSYLFGQVSSLLFYMRWKGRRKSSCTSSFVIMIDLHVFVHNLGQKKRKIKEQYIIIYWCHRKEKNAKVIRLC
jgi:hypothetical protein